MVQTILNGGTKSTQDQYTGPENELSVDQSNRNLRLHDGATPGGHVLLNRDNADARYQESSPELDGITGFEPQQRGILARLGPGDYRLRSLEVDYDNMVVANANGYDGNPIVGLNPTVTSEHTWTGQQVFTSLVQFTSQINAELVVGNLQGDVIGDLTGDVVGDLTGDATGNHEGSFTGQVDVRGKQLFLDDNQISTSKINDLINFIKLHGFPPGAVVMWSGSVATIPAGWFLCNGLNSTPDLRNKFIVGAGTGSDYAVGGTGGFAEQFPTIEIYNSASHTHALSGSTASNTTGATLNTTTVRPEYEQNQVNVIGSVTLSDPGHSHNLGGQADSGGVHNHTADITSFDNRPPFYALCYIMKG